MAEHNQAISKVARAIAGRQYDAPHPSEIAELLGQKFKGSEGFVAAWFEQLQAASIKYPGKKSTLDAYKGMFDVFKQGAESAQDERQDAAELTSEQIDLEIRACCLRLLRENPDVLTELLSELGMEVVHKPGDQVICVEDPNAGLRGPAGLGQQDQSPGS